MSFASDRLYNGYLRRNMPTIVTTVKVREIVVHLPCLTDHDRENIEAKREVCGNYDSMVVLLDCLKRRENWPEEFIKALEACDHLTIAAAIKAEYDALRGINDSNPSSPASTVVRAHVHPAPSASHLPVPESGGNSQAAVASPAEASDPPEPAAQATPPLDIPAQPQVPQNSDARVAEIVPPPEPPQPTQNEVAPPPSTPPPSPATPHSQVTSTPPPQREVYHHQEPEENSESDIQDVCGDNGVVPDQFSACNGEVSIDSVPAADPPQTTTATTAEVRPPQSPSPTQTNSDMTDGSSFPIMTPEKPPVQDTAPPVDVAAVMQPEESSEPPVTQVLERNSQTETAATSSPPPAAAGTDAPLCDDNSVCLSKPGQLISIHPQNDNSPTLPAPSSPVEPYSGNSERLEISDGSAHVPACSVVSSTTVNVVSALPCQENGIALNHNEPEENHYESPCESVVTQEVRVNVVQVSEEPSILNMDGQSSTPQAHRVNSGAAKEVASAPPLSTNAADTASSGHTPSAENHPPSDPAPADMSPGLSHKTEKAAHTQSSNTKYILTAAGVGACALLMAWKFKKGI